MSTDSVDTAQAPSGQDAINRAPRSVPLWGLLLPILTTAILLITAAQQPDGRLHVWILDLGDGDATLIRTPGGHTALIGGGPEATALLNGIDAHIPFWRHELDLLVLTDPGQNTIAGLVDVPGRYHIDQVVQPNFGFGTSDPGANKSKIQNPKSKIAEAWLGALHTHAVPVHNALRGDMMSFDGEPDVSLQVLDPGAAPFRDSIALKLTYGNTSILLEGSPQQAAESAMEQQYAEQLSSQILKVGHARSGADSNPLALPGDLTSPTPRFLADVKPQVIIMVESGLGNQGQQTGTRKTLTPNPGPGPDSLQATGAKIYRTDQNGTVEVIVDKDNLWLRSER